MQAADFEKVLRTRSRASTTHFAIHHLASVPVAVSRQAPSPVDTELSTSDAQLVNVPVDDLVTSHVGKTAKSQVFASGSTHRPTVWLGAVVPKRHAKRSVTRTLLKRQIRAAIERHRDRLPAGMWVVRLRAPFDRLVFKSASSSALRLLARSELETAVTQAAAQAWSQAATRTQGAHRPGDVSRDITVPETPRP